MAEQGMPSLRLMNLVCTGCEHRCGTVERYWLHIESCAARKIERLQLDTDNIEQQINNREF